MPKRTSLPSMLPPACRSTPRRDAERSRDCRRLGPVGDGDADEEQDAHGGEDRPALALVADHAAEDVGQRGADREDQHDLDQVGERRRVLEGMRGVGVEEAAAIGAEHLDGLLGGDRALGDRLLGAFERGRLDIGAEVLRHALPDEEQRDDDARSAAGRRACSASDRPRSCRCVLRRARAKPRTSATASAMPVAAETKLCTRQPGHLGEIAHRRFAARRTASWCW